MISASPRRLGVFKSVVDHGGFNAAANHLGIAQPSVGAHVKALECQVGQPLFFRSRGSRPKLTKAGEALYAFAVDVLQKSDETAQILTDLRKSEDREIQMSVHRDVATNILPPRLASFAARHQKIRIVTRIGTIEEVIDSLQRRTAHLGLFLSSGPIPGLHSEVLAREPLVAVVAASHPLASRRSIAAADLEGCNLVTGLQHSRYAKLVDAALRGIGIAHYNVVMELQEAPAVKEVVRQGTGIACLPLCTVREELEMGSLVVLRLTSTFTELELHCAYDASLSGTARQLATHLASSFDKQRHR